MVPPTGPLNLDVEAISGICGSISIACWVVVFSPQIFENFRRGSADGLSLQFIIVWLAGDVFNILGAVLQGVLPTMIILAFYYTIADIVLLGQCFYYRGFTWYDEVTLPKSTKSKAKRLAGAAVPAAATFGSDRATEHTALLGKTDIHHEANWSALSPAVPFVPDLDQPTGATAYHESSVSMAAAAPNGRRPALRLQTALYNALAILMVCAAGVAGWYLSSGTPDRTEQPPSPGADENPISFSVWGQIFGYLCAVLYLGSRLPQLLLNWRRQSTEGVSMLFFLFACLGNLTYVLSIFAHEEHGDYSPDEARRRYGRYLLVNLSWLAGSLGTLLLDMGIFIQFFIYQRVEGDDDLEDGDEATDVDSDDDDLDDPRPLLQRSMSNYH